jgi:hypothetical protein
LPIWNLALPDFQEDRACEISKQEHFVVLSVVLSKCCLLIAPVHFPHLAPSLFLCFKILKFVPAFIISYGIL